MNPPKGTTMEPMGEIQSQGVPVLLLQSLIQALRGPRCWPQSLNPKPYLRLEPENLR